MDNEHVKMVGKYVSRKMDNNDVRKGKMCFPRRSSLGAERRVKSGFAQDFSIVDERRSKSCFPEKSSCTGERMRI